MGEYATWGSWAWGIHMQSHKLMMNSLYPILGVSGLTVKGDGKVSDNFRGFMWCCIGSLKDTQASNECPQLEYVSAQPLAMIQAIFNWESITLNIKRAVTHPIQFDTIQRDPHHCKWFYTSHQWEVCLLLNSCDSIWADGVPCVD